MIPQTHFLETLEKIRCNQSNYQKWFMDILINSKNLDAEFEDIKQYLHEKNPSKTLASFGRSCPVWKVIMGKNLVIEKNGVFKINSKLSKDGIKAAKKIVKGLCQE